MENSILDLEKKDIRQQIFDNIHSRGIKIMWLSEKTGINHSHLARIIKMNRALTLENLHKINEALGTSFGETGNAADQTK